MGLVRGVVRMWRRERWREVLMKAEDRRRRAILITMRNAGMEQVRSNTTT